MKKFQSKAAQKYSIKVWWQKVKHPYISSPKPLHVGRLHRCTVFQSGAAQKFSIKVCLKNFSQGLVEKIKSDPDQSGSEYYSGS
jgi:hypothetical protein